MFNRRKEPQATPTVKKVSELINSKSHVQKKYISLMLVPSYSTGKTRSLRIPRVVLHILAISIFVIFSIVMGFHLRSRHFENVARNYRESLEETQDYLQAFQYEAEQIQQDLIETATDFYHAWNEETFRANLEIYRADRRHQENLEGIWDLIEALEDEIREVEVKIHEMESNLGARRIITEIAPTLARMEESQAELRASLAPPINNSDSSTPSVGLLRVGQQSAFSEDELIETLMGLLHELDVQRQLLESLEYYRQQMLPHLLNHPTLWPIRGRVSSGFGPRRNPFGGGGFEHHDGVDIPAPSGTQIRAAGGGTVTFSGWQAGYGQVIIINHGNGLSTAYAHNSLNLVNVGERVERGQVIGQVGSTGRSTAPHLHYEVRRNGNPTNPVPFLLEHHR